MSLQNWTPSDIDLDRAREVAAERRAANKVKMLHHHAFRCRSAEETRAFYEGILGFPLVAACIEPIDPLTNEPKPYMHLYFELADGSALAFFDYPAHFTPADFPEVDQFGHHIGRPVEIGRSTFTEAIEIKGQYMEAGLEQLVGMTILQPEALAGQAHRMGADDDTARR